MATFIGEIKLFAGNLAPQDWAFCQGQSLQITEHPTLFSILGTTYGGDGRITFALPDLREKVPVGNGANMQLGQTGGSESVVLAQSDLPATASAEESAPSASQSTQKLSTSYARIATTKLGRASAKSWQGIGTKKFDRITPEKQSRVSPDAWNRISATTRSVSADTAEQPQGVQNMQPYVVLNYIICLSGEYPSRS